jgi:hypothetical protein
MSTRAAQYSRLIPEPHRQILTLAAGSWQLAARRPLAGYVAAGWLNEHQASKAVEPVARSLSITLVYCVPRLPRAITALRHS